MVYSINIFSQDLKLKQLVVFVILFASVHTLMGKTITLASNGIANYNIICLPQATPTSKFANEELQKYLSQISNTHFKLLNNLKSNFIIACSANQLHLFPPDISIPQIDSKGYGIFMRNDNIFLVGGDKGETVLYAVYDFLNMLGCQWVAPDFSFFDSANQFIPKKEELKYHHSKEIIERPDLIYRKLYIEEGKSHNAGNLLELVDWMPKNRFNILVAPINYQGHDKVKWDNWREQIAPELKKRGIIIEVGGHGYQNFLNAGMENGRLFQKHPEWFGMDSESQRSKAKRMVFCTSNNNAVSYLQHNILSYLNAHPEISIFDFWPPDSEIWCECSNCKALGTPTERHTLLVSKMAFFLQQKCPDVRLECLAYSRYVQPPEHEKLDASVLLDFCPIRQSFEYQIYDPGSSNNKLYKEALLQWMDSFQGDVSIYSYYRKYAWCSLPNIIPHYMQNDLKFYRDTGVKGISVYAEPGDWFTYGLNHYVLGHLAWDPDVDVDGLVTDYCSKLYGQAGRLTMEIYATLENAVRFGCNIPHTEPKSPDVYAKYTTQIDNCRKSLDNVIKSYPSNSVVHRHLSRLHLMLDYAYKNMLLANLKNNAGSQENINQLTKDIHKMLSENATVGVFIDG